MVVGPEAGEEATRSRNSQRESVGAACSAQCERESERGGREWRRWGLARLFEDRHELGNSLAWTCRHDLGVAPAAYQAAYSPSFALRTFSAATALLADLGLSAEQAVYLDDFGHVQSVDQVLALEQASRRSLLRNGDLVVLAAAGTGYTWSAAAVRWGTS